MVSKFERAVKRTPGEHIYKGGFMISGDARLALFCFDFFLFLLRLRGPRRGLSSAYLLARAEAVECRSVKRDVLFVGFVDVIKNAFA